MVIPQINKDHKPNKYFIIPILLGGIVMTIITFLDITVFGATMVSRQFSPIVLMEEI
jgi:hypothetical protein